MAAGMNTLTPGPMGRSKSIKALQEAKMLKAQRDDLEREIYSLKHELISVQMKLDAQTEQ